MQKTLVGMGIKPFLPFIFVTCNIPSCKVMGRKLAAPRQFR
jgi:hypothetical protein